MKAARVTPWRTTIPQTKLLVMSRVSSALWRTITRIPRLLVLAVHLACVLSPLAESHGEARQVAAAHVEAQGFRGHFVHDEGPCVACIMLSVVGTSTPSHCPIAGAVAARRAEAPVGVARALHSIGVQSTYPSRAPPVVG